MGDIEYIRKPDIAVVTAKEINERAKAGKTLPDKLLDKDSIKMLSEISERRYQEIIDNPDSSLEARTYALQILNFLSSE